MFANVWKWCRSGHDISEGFGSKSSICVEWLQKATRIWSTTDSLLAPKYGCELLQLNYPLCVPNEFSHVSYVRTIRHCVQSFVWFLHEPPLMAIKAQHVAFSVIRKHATKVAILSSINWTATRIWPDSATHARAQNLCRHQNITLASRIWIQAYTMVHTARRCMRSTTLPSF
jgi:hypothetical protein